MQRRWRVAPPISPQFIEQFPEILPAVLQLVFNRGLTTQRQIDEFLNPDFSQDVHDPFLFRDMRRAVDRIRQAIEHDEQIIIHGDYDADGVCGSAILVSTLRQIAPTAKIDVYLPHRENEGYGLNLNTVAELADRGVTLLITVDCGSSNHDEITAANERGIDVIVTDHHVVPATPPPAYAILHPLMPGETYPFQKLCGTGVAYKLAQALIRDWGQPIANEKWLMDLVAIGTIADFVPLVGENRTLVTYGLIVLQKTRRLGFQKLYSLINLDLTKIDTRTVAFQIIPRINAAGRVDHARRAFDLIMTENDDDAIAAATLLNQLNQERQKLTERITQEAKTQVGELSVEQCVVVAEGEDWPAGLVGLVANRLMDEYNRPTVIIGKRQDMRIGSGRSMKEFHITEALHEMSDLLAQFGGHRQACGFTLKSTTTVAQFTKSFQQIAATKLQSEVLAPELPIDAEMTLAEVTWPLVEQVERFGPFGEGNPSPLFASKGLAVIQWDRVGADRKHLRLVVKDQQGIQRKMIGFGFGKWSEQLTPDCRVDVAYEIGTNTWNGNSELQLKIIDIRIAND